MNQATGGKRAQSCRMCKARRCPGGEAGCCGMRGGRADHGPAERWQHAGRLLEFTERAGVLAARVMEACVLDRLAAAGLVDAAALAAGLRLQADYHTAHMESRVIASYNPARGTRQGGYDAYERNEAEEAAYQRWRLAVRAVGMVDSGIVLGACCEERMPKTQGLAALRRGLGRLAAFYGI